MTREQVTEYIQGAMKEKIADTISEIVEEGDFVSGIAIDGEGGRYRAEGRVIFVENKCAIVEDDRGCQHVIPLSIQEGTRH